jgi:hypothetical protein
MRVTVLAAVAVSVVFSASASAAPSATNACPNQTNALGVSRIVEVDTSDGPRFGHQQYSAVDLLKDDELR